MTRHVEVFVEPLADGALILKRSDGGFVNLSGIAVEIWARLDDGESAEAVAQFLECRYGLSAADAVEVVASSRRELAAAGLI